MMRLKTVWRLLNLPCREMTRLASASLEGDLSRLERIVLKTHLLYCIACRRYLRQIVFVKRALRQIVQHVETGATLPGPGLPEDVRARIKQALREN
jgi:predicted anti-sigma-YlaC factor YlaD